MGDRRRADDRATGELPRHPRPRRFTPLKDSCSVRVRVIHNVGAGDGAIGKDALKHAINIAGHQIVSYATTDDKWRRGISRRDDLVVVAGGDGTVRKALTAIVSSPARVGIVPLGRANNIARSLGADSDDPLSVISSWADPVPVIHLDIPTVESRKGHRPFVEGVGGGLFAELVRRADQREADTGRSVDVWHTFHQVLRDSEARPWNVGVDGDDRSGRYLAVHATTLVHTGPNIPIAPAPVRTTASLN